MGNARKYPNAPITEAIIQLLVTPGHGIAVGDVARCHEGEEKSYPIQRNFQIAQGHFEMGPRVSAAASAQHVGFIFVSEDQRQVFQVRLDGFSFSRLSPYESWEPFCQEARRLWQIDTLHVRKNEVFEACITDRARELFQ